MPDIIFKLQSCTEIVSFGNVTPDQREAVESFDLAIDSWDEFLLLVS